MSGQGARLICEDLMPLLKRVSRAFYLTIAVLPRNLRRPVGLAYLLARVADTVADTSSVPTQRRLHHLLAMRKWVSSDRCGDSIGELQESLTDAQSSATDRDLILSLPQALEELRDLDDPDRRLVSEIVVNLTQGIEFDLRRFPPEQSGNVHALKSAEELDRYTYLVAGCVGEFWTDITMAHTPEIRSWDRDRMASLGVAFGKALQLTNLLRDVPSDLQIGRCYIPSDWLAELGLTPPQLLDPRNDAAARPALARGVEIALQHFSLTECYVRAIPRRCIRLRLAAMWPLLMGLATLAETVENPAWLDPRSRSAVSRPWVYRMMAMSLLFGHSNRALSLWTRRLRRRVRSALVDTPLDPIST